MAIPSNEALHPLFAATSEQDWRAKVGAFLAEREDGTKPEHGWPWPWEDGHLTDFSYAYDAGAVHCSHYGHAWTNPLKPVWEPINQLAEDASEEEQAAHDSLCEKLDEEYRAQPKAEFPNMKLRFPGASPHARQALGPHHPGR